MATVIRIIDQPHGGPHFAAVAFDDLAAEADRRLDEAKVEAERIVADARREADAIRRRAAEQGAQSAVMAVDQMVAERLTPAVDALREAAEGLGRDRQKWLAHWEAAAVRLAAAMASRVIRGELSRQPQIPIRLIREALELAAGCSNVRLHVNPDDHKSLGAEVHMVASAASSLGNVDVIPDAAISRGGCRVETRFGTIDQQIETQLKRIEEELTL